MRSPTSVTFLAVVFHLHQEVLGFTTSSRSLSHTRVGSTTKLAFGSKVAQSFVAPHRPPSSTSSRLSLVPPELQHVASNAADAVDLNAVHAAVAPHLSEIFRATSTVLADASDAAVASDAAAAAAANDGGWWASYLNIFKSTLEWVHSQVDGPLRSVGITQTWGISIALFTAGVRSVLLPLSIQQSKSSEYMKALKPYQDEIKEKFKDNKDMQNRAIAKLFEDSGTNPLSGCLISLAQLPIFIGLYRSVTLLAKDGQLQEPFLWIPTLEGPVSPPTYRGMEWLTQGWHSVAGSSLPVPQLGWETTIAFLIMPCILVLGQSLTMSVLTPPVSENASDEEKEQFEKSQGFLKFLPLMIGYFSLQVPAGLTIYWLTSNAYTLAQSLGVKAYYAANPPEIELPEYWDALDDMDNMSPEEKREAAKAGLATGPKFEDLMDEARFHYVVERTPLREGSAAWERTRDAPRVPSELAEWVGGGIDGGVGGHSISNGAEEVAVADVESPALEVES